MRIWDISVTRLCDKHLLAEHRELHAIWVYLTTNKGGSYRKHPETLRWKNKLTALWDRHERQVSEFEKRGWGHFSYIGFPKEGFSNQDIKLISIKKQQELLRTKNCKCKV